MKEDKEACLKLLLFIWDNSSQIIMTICMMITIKILRTDTISIRKAQ